MQPVIWGPHSYQIDALKFIMRTPHCGIFLDPGMGKTSTTLAAITHLRQTESVNRILIVAPIRPMYQVWPVEIKKWMDFNHLSYTVLHGDDKDANLNRISDIYLINPEGLKWFFAAKGLEKIKADMLVIDESTKFKDYSTARFKLLKPVLPLFKRRIILTGEPAPNGYMDLFGQCYIMDLGASLGRFITHYRAQYFFQEGQPVHAGHVDVGQHQHDFVAVLQLPQGFLAVCGEHEFIGAALDLFSESLENEHLQIRLIVDHHDLEHVHADPACPDRASDGNSTTKVAPPSGLSSMVNVPPWAFTMSWVMESPRPVPWVPFLVVKKG